MRRTHTIATIALALSLGGCAGYRSGWESVPFIGDRPPTLQAAETPHESHQRRSLSLPDMVLGVSINNQVRTSDTQVYAFVLPLAVDPRTVRTAPSQPGRTRVNLQISGLQREYVFNPPLARFAVGDKMVQAVGASEFGMWDQAGQRVAAGGTWASKPIQGPMLLQDRSNTYLLSIDFPIDAPSPESTAISLDLSRALTAPGGLPLPLIKFVPARWKHGYT